MTPFPRLMNALYFTSIRKRDKASRLECIAKEFSECAFERRSGQTPTLAQPFTPFLSLAMASSHPAQSNGSSGQQRMIPRDAPIYGNYASYASKRGTSLLLGDRRVGILPLSWVEGKRVLDVGCNSGQVSVELGKSSLLLLRPLAVQADSSFESRRSSRSSQGRRGRHRPCSRPEGRYPPRLCQLAPKPPDRQRELLSGRAGQRARFLASWSGRGGAGGGRLPGQCRVCRCRLGGRGHRVGRGGLRSRSCVSLPFSTALISSRFGRSIRRGP